MFFLAVSGIYSILASYLESILTFFLTVFLAFYLASAICSDILSGRLWCSDPGVAHRTGAGDVVFGSRRAQLHP